MNVGDKIQHQGELLEVLFVTSADRVLVDYRAGIVVALDREDGAWILSGTPASVEENKFIIDRAGFGDTVVTVTKDP